MIFSEVGGICVAQLIQIYPADPDFSACGGINRGEYIEQRCLSLSCQVISKKNIEFTQKERLPISAIFHNSLS